MSCTLYFIRLIGVKVYICLKVATTKYLVTGGAGFICSHISEALLDRGDSVRIFDNLATGRISNLTALKGRAEFVESDLRNLASIRSAVEGVQVAFHYGGL